MFSEDLTHASLSRRNVSCSSQFVLEYWPASAIHCPCLMYSYSSTVMFPSRQCVVRRSQGNPCRVLSAFASCQRSTSITHSVSLVESCAENMVTSTLIRTPDMIAAPSRHKYTSQRLLVSHRDKKSRKATSLVIEYGSPDDHPPPNSTIITYLWAFFPLTDQHTCNGTQRARSLISSAKHYDNGNKKHSATRVKSAGEYAWLSSSRSSQNS